MTEAAGREPARELRAEAVVAAPPQQVWETLTDLSRMPGADGHADELEAGMQATVEPLRAAVGTA